MPSRRRVPGKTQEFIVARIRREMDHRRMSQSELSRQSGVPVPTLSKLLKGDSMLDVEQAEVIANVFDLSLWELAAPPEIAT